MTPDEARALAESNFHNGCTCSQAVLCTFAEDLGLSKENAMKVALAFGGGMCRMREVCGTVSGMLMALGMLEGCGDISPKNEKDGVYEHGQLLAQKFSADHGSIICRELLGLVPMGTSTLGRSQAQLAEGKSNELAEMTVPTSAPRTESYYKKRPCEKLCGDAAALFAEYLADKK